MRGPSQPFPGPGSLSLSLREEGLSPAELGAFTQPGTWTGEGDREPTGTRQTMMGRQGKDSSGPKSPHLQDRMVATNTTARSGSRVKHGTHGKAVNLVSLSER